MLTLSEIYIYPIKSLGGISVESGIVEHRGLKNDRRLMLVDKNGIFFTQRDFPQMALLQPSIFNDELTVVDQRDNSSVKISLNNNSGKSLKVEIWGDVCSAVKISKDADDFFSEALKFKCSLVFMPEEEKRFVDREKKYVNEEYIVSFADGYPFLIIGQSSLDDLNSRLEIPLPINRFRPNFVFTGGKPNEEDNWNDFQIGEVTFCAVKPCARCVITTTNQKTAERSQEPLRTLATYRKDGNKVLFGMNLISKNLGTVSTGNAIELL